jgi:hypothetical protein
MSPSLSPAARAAGSRLTDEARTAIPAKWKCSLCGANGQELSRKAATRASDHHYLTDHYQRGA